MANKYVIYAYPGNRNSWKALIAAEYGGIHIEYPSFNMGVDNKTPEFLKKNPTGQVPTLDTPDGPIFESNAIAKYVARKGSDKGLYGANEYEASVIDQWIEFLRSNLERDGFAIVGPILGFAEFNQAAHDKAKESLFKNLAILDAHFASNEWFVGKRVTLADIIYVVAAHAFFTMVLDAEDRKKFSHVTAWFGRATSQPQFSKILGEIKYAEKELAAGALKRA